MILGAIVGDIVGSWYEFRPIKTKDFELFPKGCGITDDSIMTLAVMDCLLNQRNPVESFQDWAFREYPIVGGYGQRFLQWLCSPNPKPYGSCGNGAAMRISPVAWYARDEEELFRLTDDMTCCTHNHPEGMKAARATTHAIWLARKGLAGPDISKVIAEVYGYDLSRSVDDIRPGYRHIETSQDSVPEAIICALTATSYEDALRNAVSLGGDADSQAAISPLRTVDSIPVPSFRYLRWCREGPPRSIPARRRSWLR